MSEYGGWPTVDELRKVLNVDNDGADGWEPTLARVLEAAIDQVKADVGAWDDLLDLPDHSHAQAALRMAELLSLRPESAAVASTDPTYQRLLKGRRRRFAIS